MGGRPGPEDEGAGREGGALAPPPGPDIYLQPRPRRCGRASRAYQPSEARSARRKDVRAAAPEAFPTLSPEGGRVALPGAMGRAGEPDLRGRKRGRRRDPLRRCPGADRSPRSGVLTPRAYGLWTFPRPFAGRQLDLDGASPTFVRQVRHFTSSSPPTRLRAGRRSPAFCQKLSRVRTSRATAGRGGQLAPARGAWRGVELRVAVTSRPGSERSPAH